MVAVPYSRSTESQVSLIRKELVALTQNSQVAVVLNQLLYWCQRVKDFDLFLEEERSATPTADSPLNYGWMYKTADELIKETLLTVTRPTMRKYLTILVREGWMEEKTNPDRKWDRTSHFRLNLRKIHEKLISLGYTLPGFEKDLFDDCNRPRNLTSRLKNLPDEEERNLISKLENLTDEEERNLTPKLKNLTRQERNFTPKLKNLTAYTYTETTQKNTNKEHTEKACVRESFSALEKAGNSELGNSTGDDLISDEFASYESVSEEMIRLWEYHVGQKLSPENWRGVLHLTEGRKDQLESLLAFHFQNDIRLWERFCLRVKAAPFLMGEGPNGWKTSLDWILCEANFLKVLEGNYDDLERGTSLEAGFEFDLAKMQPNPVRDSEKAAILASIKDPVWKGWCSQLAIGVRLNDLKMLEVPLYLDELSQIANARFLECEDERLIWVGSSDPSVLRSIDNLGRKITWVFAKDYPKARTIRTRLESEHYLPSPHTIGDNHHVQ